ncbi:hypothetical protein Vadar_023185 [Vaccinium darrowii]|uniref:Uncharacterized protein n=1 Tax=Vaccinium darrowii TaxID=229202 RepID=A0ACB7XT72_9ERIC|nr:hypothetical protein Vadar_023185 [Vaccinium darrowii]
METKCLAVISDSQLIVGQVPREGNLEEDQLARLATVKDELIPRDVMMQYLENPSIVQPIIEVKVVEYAGSWAEPIMKYIHDGEVPSDKDQARKLRVRASRCALMGDVLYRRSFTLPYLRCLVKTEAEQAMNEHDCLEIVSSESGLQGTP